MKTVDSKGPRFWEMALPIMLGIAAWMGTAAVVPGASCRDGSPSSAIGRRGACSHHGGVQRGWGWIGILPGLFVWGCATNLLESRRNRGVERQTTPAAPAPRPEPPRKLVGPRPVDQSQALRGAIGISADVSFAYLDDAGLSPIRMRPRWLQMAEPHGERTLCVMADCPATGILRPYALDRMTGLNVIEQDEIPERR